MRVHLTRETKQERDGLFKKKSYFGVLLQIEFSEEELAIIKENDLGRAEILKVGLDPLALKRLKGLIEDGNVDVNDEAYDLHIRNLLPKKRSKKGEVWERHYASLLEADNLEKAIKEKLPGLKDFIMANGGEQKEGTEVLEF